MSTEVETKKEMSYAEAGLVWENRSRVVALEGTTKYIEKTLKSIEEKIDAFILKADQSFATREYVDSQIKIVQKDYTPFVSGAGDIIKFVLFAVLGAVIALIIK